MEHVQNSAITMAVWTWK